MRYKGSDKLSEIFDKLSLLFFIFGKVFDKKIINQQKQKRYEL